MSLEEKTVYQTWIEGFESDWTEWDNNIYKEFTNLPEGDYVFHVRARNIFGDISEEAQFAFSVLPPWYRTWWAWASMFFLAALIVAFIVWLRSRGLKKANYLLEEKVRLRTHQLNKSLEYLKATQSQLIQSEKMASLGELTAGIAHEIQNPLNFVNNFSELSMELVQEIREHMKNGTPEEADEIAGTLEDNLNKITHHGKRADGIVKGMLEHSRAGRGAKESTDINALADEYLRLSYHGLRAKDKSFNASMETNLDPTAGEINIVQQDIGRVILNILNNAFYAVNEKAKTAGPGYTPAVSVSTRKISQAGGKELVEVAIADNGNGIPPSFREKIFRPFFTTKPAGKGTGLGLSISYDIVTKGHQGEIKVESEENKGTRFIIYLPVERNNT